MAAAKKRVEKSANAFRSIGEAASELGLETHVLRYWETKFPKTVRPVKRPDGRRLFRPQDIDSLRAIQILVHERGMTLKGAKALLTEQGIDAVLTGEATVGNITPVTSPARALHEKVALAFDASLPKYTNEQHRERLEDALGELKDLKSRLDKVRTNKAA
jgi:DNA-binding transcriptional MerR regulator